MLFITYFLIASEIMMLLFMSFLSHGSTRYIPSSYGDTYSSTESQQRQYNLKEKKNSTGQNSAANWETKTCRTENTLKFSTVGQPTCTPFFFRRFQNSTRNALMNFNSKETQNKEINNKSKSGNMTNKYPKQRGKLQNLFFPKTMPPTISNIFENYTVFLQGESSIEVTDDLFKEVSLTENTPNIQTRGVKTSKTTTNKIINKGKIKNGHINDTNSKQTPFPNLDDGNKQSLKKCIASTTSAKGNISNVDRDSTDKFSTGNFFKNIFKQRKNGTNSFVVTNECNSNSDRHYTPYYSTQAASLSEISSRMKLRNKISENGLPKETKSSCTETSTSDKFSDHNFSMKTKHNLENNKKSRAFQQLTSIFYKSNCSKIEKTTSTPYLNVVTFNPKYGEYNDGTVTYSKGNKSKMKHLVDFCKPKLKHLYKHYGNVKSKQPDKNKTSSKGSPSTPAINELHKLGLEESSSQSYSVSSFKISENVNRISTIDTKQLLKPKNYNNSTLIRLKNIFNRQNKVSLATLHTEVNKLGDNTSTNLDLSSTKNIGDSHGPLDFTKGDLNINSTKQIYHTPEATKVIKTKSPSCKYDFRTPTNPILVNKQISTAHTKDYMLPDTSSNKGFNSYMSTNTTNNQNAVTNLTTCSKNSSTSNKKKFIFNFNKAIVSDKTLEPTSVSLLSSVSETHELEENSSNLITSENPLDISDLFEYIKPPFNVSHTKFNLKNILSSRKHAYQSSKENATVSEEPLEISGKDKNGHSLNQNNGSNKQYNTLINNEILYTTEYVYKPVMRNEFKKTLQVKVFKSTNHPLLSDILLGKKSTITKETTTKHDSNRFVEVEEGNLFKWCSRSPTDLSFNFTLNGNTYDSSNNWIFQTVNSSEVMKTNLPKKSQRIFKFKIPQSFSKNISSEKDVFNESTSYQWNISTSYSTCDSETFATKKNSSEPFIGKLKKTKTISKLNKSQTGSTISTDSSVAACKDLITEQSNSSVFYQANKIPPILIEPQKNESDKGNLVNKDTNSMDSSKIYNTKHSFQNKPLKFLRSNVSNINKNILKTYSKILSQQPSTVKTSNLSHVVKNISNNINTSSGNNHLLEINLVNKDTNFTNNCLLYNPKQSFKNKFLKFCKSNVSKIAVNPYRKHPKLLPEPSLGPRTQNLSSSFQNITQNFNTSLENSYPDEINLEDRGTNFTSNCTIYSPKQNFGNNSLKFCKSNTSKIIQNPYKKYPKLSSEEPLKFKNLSYVIHNITQRINATYLAHNDYDEYVDFNAKMKATNTNKTSSNDTAFHLMAFVMKPFDNFINAFRGAPSNNVSEIRNMNISSPNNGTLHSQLHPQNSSIVILAVNATHNITKAVHQSKMSTLDLLGGFFHCFLESYIEPKIQDVHFYLYTRKNVDVPEELFFTIEDENNTNEIPLPIFEQETPMETFGKKRETEDDYEFEPLDAGTSAIDSKVFNVLSETKVLVHGYVQDYQTDIMVNMKNAYLNKGSYNVILVDWSVIGNNSCYPMVATKALKAVGNMVAQLIDRLVEGGVSTGRIHLVGFSLGAHVGGHAGTAMKYGLISRITGLDPALPYIPMDPIISLDASDANFVDVIHSAAGFLGQPGPQGHADFYPNGGSQQPGCDLSSLGACSHRRAALYFIESISEEEGFQATLCNSWHDYLKNNCNDAPTLPMGDPCPTTASGKYYLMTGQKEPFMLPPEEHAEKQESEIFDLLYDM